MRAPLLGVALALAWLPAVAAAQSLALTEAEALARISDESPRVRAIRSGIDVARADVLMAGRWPNPRVSWNRESVAGNTEHITSVAQPLPITGRRRFEVQAASALVDATSSRADEAVRRARADMKQAFAELLSAQWRERDLQRARTQLQDVVDILTRREAAGDSAGFDRLRAERELFELDADAALASVDRARAQGALAAFFVSVAPASLAATESPAIRYDVPPLAELVATAEARRGELAALQYEASSSAWMARAAERRRIPEPEVIAGTKSSSLNGGDVGSVISVVATVPLFERGKPEQAIAAARRQQATTHTELFRQTLRADIATLREVLERRREAASNYRNTALASVGEIERVARVSYDAGERGILELLDAYRTGHLTVARQAALDLAVRQAEVELEFVTGWEFPQ